MARYVVDAPTLLHVVSVELRIHPDHQLLGPHVLRSQALGLLYEQVQRGRLTTAEALRLHERLTELRIRLLGDRVSRRKAWQIATDLGWDAIGDAEYLVVAQLRADALVTVDGALAGRAAGIVPVASVDALTTA
jgi:predicted nucleic acid-binding protein